MEIYIYTRTDLNHTNNNIQEQVQSEREELNEKTKSETTGK